MLGWHSADERELFTLDELCEVFSLERVNKANAIFDLAKLDWMNGQYLCLSPLEEIALRCKQLFLEKGFDISDTKKYHLSIVVARNAALCLMSKL